MINGPSMSHNNTQQLPLFVDSYCKCLIQWMDDMASDRNKEITHKLPTLYAVSHAYKIYQLTDPWEMW